MRDRAYEEFRDAFDRYQTAQTDEDREDAIVAMILKLSDRLEALRAEFDNPRVTVIR